MATSDDNKNNPFLIPNMNEPSKPLSMVTIPNPITLTSTNYLSWKTQVEAVLIGYDLYKHLDGTFPAPPTTITLANDTTTPNPSYRTWFRQDKLIFGALIGTISSNLVPLISEAKTAYEMWDILAKTYGKPKIFTEYTHQIIDLTSPPSLPFKRGGKTAASKQKRRKKNNVNEGDQMSDKLDRISILPNDILVYMLSFVEMKTAGKTSLLSKRWRYVWTHLIDLDFDEPELFLARKREVDSQVDRYIRRVNKVITMSRASYLNTFRIHFPLYGSYVADIDKWIKFALSKNVSNLELSLSTIFGSNYIGTAYIVRPDFLLFHPVYNDHLTTLKSLHLEALVVEGLMLENVLAYCLNLERLTVRSCSFYSAISSLIQYSPPKQRLVISSLKLKHLELCYCHHIESLKISAPKLTSFIFFAGYKKIEVEYTCIPSLVNVTFGGPYCYYLIQNLHLLSNFSCRLEKLSIHWDRETSTRAEIPIFPEDNFLTLISFIEACPLLHTFKLELWPSTRKVVPMSAVNDVPVNCAMRTHKQLTVVEFVGFDGNASVAELALCLTQNAPMLKKIICDPHCPQSTGNLHKWYDTEYIDRIAPARRQAKLLAKQIRGVDVVIL